MQARRLALSSFLSIVVICIVLSLTLPLAAQNGDIANPLSVRPQDRVTGYVDDTQRVTITGNRYPLAVPANEAGTAFPDMRMDHMILSLRPSAAQQSAMEALATAQYDPASPYYHQWLTPETYAEHFGVSEYDVQQVSNWLRSHGMTVDEVVPGRSAIIFSGTVGQVEEAFHAPIKKYQVQGVVHYANSADPQIPQALSAVVNGPVSLHDFYATPNLVKSTPDFTVGNGGHYLSPADWTTIYDVTPLYGQGLDGAGQSIAVLGRSDIDLTDVAAFRKNAGLPANVPQVILGGNDPGTQYGDAEESTLDVEWAGAIAKNATIKFVTSATAYPSDGIHLSALYAVTNDVAPIIALSYSSAETMLGTTETTFLNNLWNAATLQGQTVLVASGDGGDVACNGGCQGEVNGYASSPYDTSVGGTMFNDTSNPGTYWAATNAGGMSSALGYIPEVAWNESATSGGASGGGASPLYSKPKWQSAPGVPADGQRDLPDLAVTAAAHDAYVIQFQGAPAYVSGTSAATAALASFMALVVQNSGTGLGNINPTLYGLATNQYSTHGAAVYHDITSGNNTIAGQTGTGNSAGTGYDLVTGLGSIDGQLLVNHWNDGIGSSTPDFQISGAKNATTVALGASSSVTYTVTGTGGFSSYIYLSVSGLPANVTSSFSPSSIPPWFGTSMTTNLTLTAGANAKPGVYPLVITATCGSTGGACITKNTDLSLTVGTPPGLTLTPSLVEFPVLVGSTGSITLTTAATNGLSSLARLLLYPLPECRLA